MTGAGKRAALYFRISKEPRGKRSSLRDESGASYSIEDQDVRCEELCERAGYQIVARFYDDGISAYRSLKDRPGYGDMKAALADDAFDVLIFDRQDRLARDQTQTLRFVADCKEAGIAWHSVREQHVDLSEPMQVLFAIFRGGEAERYSATISANQKAGNQRKRELGLPGAGPRPFGFEDDKITLRHDESELIRLGTEMILSGSARYQVMQAFRESGIKTTNGKEWHSAKITKLLTRWRNAGLVEHMGEPFGKAIWPAIVSKEDVQNVRTILARGRAPGRWKSPTMLCSGIARCRCGYQLVATGSTIGPAYRCGEIIAKAKDVLSAGPHVTIGAHVLDPLVRDAVIDAYFKRPATAGAGKIEATQIARLYKRREAVEADLAKAKQGFMLGILDAVDAARVVAKSKAEIAYIDREAASLTAASAHAAMLDASMNALVMDLDLQAESLPGDASYRPGLALVQSARRDGRTREEALDALARARWWRVGDDGGPVWTVHPAIRDAVGDRFDGMTLEQRRHLVRSLVTITVQPGQGGGRVDIEPIETKLAAS